MKSRSGYVSNSSSSSFLIPGTKENAEKMSTGACPVPCLKLPEEIWRKIEQNHVDWEGRKLEMSSVSDEWWLTTLVSDCMEHYSEVAGMPGAIAYLEGHDAPYGWYDDESGYIMFKRGGDEFYVDAYDFIGNGALELPGVVELREKAREILDSKSMNKSQKLDALKCLFNY